MAPGCAHHKPQDLGADLPEKADAPPSSDPRTVLEEAAASEDPSARAPAIGHLIAVDPAPAGGQWGPRALFDPDGWVERAGIEALSHRIGEPETVALLEEYLVFAPGDVHSRAEAGLLLVDHGVKDDRITGMWRQETSPWRMGPLALPGAVAGDADSLSALELALSTGSIGLEPDFLRTLAARAPPGLADAAARGAGKVEEMAAIGYAGARLALGDVTAEDVLRRALTGEDQDDAMAALDAIGAVPGPVVDGLIRRAKATGTDFVRAYADLLLAARSGDGLDAFPHAMDEDDRDLRKIALELLPEAAEAAADPRKLGRWADAAIRVGLGDADPLVRAEAVRAAIALDRRDLAPRIAPLVADGTETVRIEAAGALLRWKP